jgi:hypothetical protein
MAERVAVLGTGIMGAPMARNLLKAGFQVRVWNRTPEKARVLAAEGADLAETPADAVREAAFVITMLTDAAAVLAVMRQAAECADGAVWLQTSMDTDVECPPGSRRTTGSRSELSRARHQGEAMQPARRARIWTRQRPRPGTADLRRDRVEDRQARAGGRPGEPQEARGERLDRGVGGDPPLPAEPRCALGVLA